MNEQAINDLYEIAKQNGYSKSRDEFVSLLHTNEKAFGDMYSLAQSNGYQKSQDDFAILVGKKKSELTLETAQPEPTAQAQPIQGAAQQAQEMPATGLPSVASSSASSSAETPEDRGLTLLTPEFGKKVAQQEKTGTYMGGKPFELTKEQKKEFSYELPKSESDFNKSLANVNKELIDNDEEYIVPQLNYMFGAYGFTFNETGAGDMVEVVAPNGEKKTVPVDMWTQAEDLNSSNELKKFIEDNKPRIAKVAAEYENYDKNFYNQKEVDDAIAQLNNEAQNLNAEQKSVAAEKLAIDKQVEELKMVPASQRNTAEYIAKVNELQSKKSEIEAKITSITEKEKLIPMKEASLQRSAGRYASMKSKQGGLGGASWNSILDETQNLVIGLNDINDRITSFFVGLTTGDKESAEALRMGKKIMAEASRGELKEAIGAQYVTEEYMQAAQEDFVKRNVIGVAAMAPVIVGGILNPAAATPIASTWFFGTTYDHAMQEMDSNPAFKDISENEKLGVATVLGVVNATIATKGVAHIMNNSGLMSTLTMNAIKKMGTETTAKTLAEFVSNEVSRGIARGAITASTSAATGAVTGAEIKISELLIKDAYNLLKDKKAFNTPATVSEYIDEVTHSAIDMAVGGVLLSLPNTLATSYRSNNFNGITDKKLAQIDAIANDPIIKAAFVTDIKNKILNGTITASEGQKQLDAFNNSVSIYNSIPKDLTPAAKRKAMGLMLEKKSLESYIVGKDEALVKKQKERIAEINDELSKVGEMKEQAKPTEAAAEAAPASDVDKKAEIERRLGIKLPAKNSTLPILPKTWGDKKSLADQISSELEGVIERGVPIQEWLDKGYSRLLSSWTDETVIEFLEVVEEKLAALGVKPAEAAPAEDLKQKMEQELREALPYDYFEDNLNSEFEWQRESAKEFLADPKAYFEKNIEVAKRNLERDPDDVIAKRVLEDNTEKLRIFNEITDKYKQDAIQKPSTEEGVLRAEQPQVELPKVGEGDQEQVPTEKGVAKEEEVRFLSEEEQARKTDLEEALKQPENEKGTVTIGEELVERQKARDELDELSAKEFEGMLAQEEKVSSRTPEGKPVSVSNKEQLKELASKTTDALKSKVISAASRAVNTLKSVFPEMDIILHDNKESYMSAGGSKKNSGIFQVTRDANGKIVKGEIHIDLSSANLTTVAHEVAHAVMLKAFGESPALFERFRNKINEVLSESTIKKLNEFADQYDKLESHEEYLVQLSAILSANEKQIPTSVVQRIAELINKVVSKVTNGALVPFKETVETKQLIDFLNTMSSSIAKGEEIKVESMNIDALQQGMSSNIGEPTTITKPQLYGKEIDFPEEPSNLSFVTKNDKIDINALIDEIVAKKQKVWFWMADQLGRGEYNDEVIEGTHYLDAGPSFALDPANRSKGILWASGLAEKTLQSQIDKSDYIFFISGSPEKSKLFNKTVLKLVAERVNKNSDFQSFKDAINSFGKETNELKTMKKALAKVNSFDELANSTMRKEFLLAIDKVGKLKTAPEGSLKSLLASFNAFVDYNELRDGFYKEHGFSQNDIMLVGKPTKLGGKAPHSTYENAIMGEVVGVPDRKVDSWELMSQDIKDKYASVIKGKEEKTKPLQTKIIAAETGVVRGLEGRAKAGEVTTTKQQVEAYHGSPHDFEKFTTKKMGTGEGAQAFGWGMYFTDVKSIAEHYTKELSRPDFDKLQQRLLKSGESNWVINDILDYTMSYGNDYGKIIKALRSNENEDAIKYLEKNKDIYESVKGKTYTVTLHEGKTPDQYTWLEWEKELTPSQIKKILDKDVDGSIQEALNKYYSEYNDISNVGELIDIIREENTTGERLYKILENYIGEYPSDKEASLALLRAGIDGIKYPAESISRGATSETSRGSNYVVFDENAVTIKTKEQRASNKEAEDLVKRGRASGLSEGAIQKVLERRGFAPEEIDAAMAKPEAGKKIELSEEMMQGYNDMMADVDTIIERGLNRNAKQETILKNVMKSVVESDAYKNATDQQKEQITREVKEAFGERIKAAPSVGRLLGTIEDVKKITMTEKSLYRKRLKDLEEGAKTVKDAISKATKEMTISLTKMVKQGKIAPAQMRSIINKFGSLNVLNEKSVQRFTDYMSKVLADADYDQKLSDGFALKKRISKLSRNKDKNAHLRDLAKRFSELDPSLIDNIVEYNEVASKIAEAVKGSTIRMGKVTEAQTVNIEQANEYIKEKLEQQKDKLYQEKLAEVQELMGVDASDLSYEQLSELVRGDKPITKYNESIVRTAIEKMFDMYSTVIKDMFDKSKDPFTGQDLVIDQVKKDLVNKFMDMDPNKLSPREALDAVDSLTNFMQNGSTAKMEAVVSEYNGRINAEKLESMGVKSKELKAYRSTTIGKLFGEYFMSLPLLMERMFKDFKKASMVQRMSGLTNLINKKAEASAMATRISNDYVGRFYNQKANGADFNTAYNSTERGLAAFMTRTVIGTQKEMDVEFNVRKKFIEESIEVLSKGTDSEKQKAELYQQAYDKILKDSKNADEVRSKTDAKNLEAVEYWVEKWSEIYDELSDVSENVYNTLLDKDLNYTPDRYTKLEEVTQKTELGDNDSSFLYNLNTLYKRKTGALMEIRRKKEGDALPKADGGKRASMYIDLSFDVNNVNSMHDALVDMKTASAIREVQSFINSDSFNNIMAGPEDSKLLKSRIQLFVRNMRDKNIVESDSMTKLGKKLESVAAIGVGQALGGVMQPLKQTIPVAMNTIMNTGRLDLSLLYNKAVNDFLDNSGYAIAGRGIASTSELASINKLVDLASKSKGEKALKFIEEANKKWLDIFLVKFDVGIARASWMTYYEKSLRQQGIDTKGIDYTTHKLNEQAADYAQRMVDRQQNISDHDLAGKMFVSKDPVKKMIVKTVMPFASFRINQFMRASTDLSILSNKAASAEDRFAAARSLSGFAAEMFTFKMISAGSLILMGTLTKALMGKDEDDDEYQKRVDGVMKGQATSTFTDVLSPLPIADRPVQWISANLLSKVQDIIGVEEDEKVSIYEKSKSDMTSSFGTLGITAERFIQLADLIRLSATGEYTDDYGNTKTISEEDQEVLKYMVGLSVLSNVGLAPTEVNSIVRNSIKFSKQKPKKEKKKKEKDENPYGLSKKDLKRYFPDLYNEKYGPESPNYETEQQIAKTKKEMSEMKREAKDAMYNYTEKSKSKKKSGPFSSEAFEGGAFEEKKKEKNPFEGNAFK